MQEITNLLCSAVSIFTMLIIVRVVLSWFPSTSGGFIAQVSYFVGRITEPVLGAVRQRLPRTGAIDFSCFGCVVIPADCRAGHDLEVLSRACLTRK